MTKHFLSSQGKQRDSLSSTVKKQFVAIQPQPYNQQLRDLLELLLLPCFITVVLFISHFQNICNLNVSLLPQPIIAAFPAKKPHGVGDRLATDVAATACGIGDKPRHCVYEIFHCERERASSRVNRPLRIRTLLLSWGVGRRNDHITTSMNEPDDIIRKTFVQIHAKASGKSAPIFAAWQTAHSDTVSHQC